MCSVDAWEDWMWGESLIAAGATVSWDPALTSEHSHFPVWNRGFSHKRMKEHNLNGDKKCQDSEILRLWKS